MRLASPPCCNAYVLAHIYTRKAIGLFVVFICTQENLRSSSLSTVAASAVIAIREFLADQESLNMHNWNTFTEISQRFPLAMEYVNRPNVFLSDPLVTRQGSAFNHLDVEELIAQVMLNVSRCVPLAQSFRMFFESFGTKPYSSINLLPTTVLTPLQCATDTLWGVRQFLIDHEALLKDIRHLSEGIAAAAANPTTSGRHGYVGGTYPANHPWRLTNEQWSHVFIVNPNNAFDINECIVRTAVNMMLSEKSAIYYRQHFQSLYKAVILSRPSMPEFIDPFGSMYVHSTGLPQPVARPQSTVHVQRPLSPPLVFRSHRLQPTPSMIRGPNLQLQSSTIHNQSPQPPLSTICNQTPPSLSTFRTGTGWFRPNVPQQRVQPFQPVIPSPPFIIRGQRPWPTPTTIPGQNLQPQSSTIHNQSSQPQLSTIRDQTPPPLSTLSGTVTVWSRPNVPQRRVQPFQPVIPSPWIQRSQPADPLDPSSLYTASVSSPLFIGLRPFSLSQHSNQLDTTNAPRPDRTVLADEEYCPPE